MKKKRSLSQKKRHEQLNIWLFIKQGLKSLFKNKLQLVIITVLAFLAALLLSTGMGAAALLNKNFHNYVDQPRFDTSYTYNDYAPLGGTTAQGTTNNTYFAPFMDLEPQSITNKNGSDFNMMFNNSNYQKNQANPFDFLDPNNSTDVKLWESLFSGKNPVIDSLYHSIDTNGHFFNTTKNSFSLNYNNNWMNQAYTNYVNLLGSGKLANTAIGAAYKTYQQQHIGVKNNVNNFLNANNNLLLNYVQHNLTLALNWLTYRVSELYYHLYQQSPAGTTDINTFNTNASKYLLGKTSSTVIPFWGNSATAPSTGTLNTLQEVLWEYLSGTTLPGKGNPPTGEIPSTDIGIVPNFLGKYDLNTKTTPATSDNTTMANNHDYFTKGWRGIMNPIIYLLKTKTEAFLDTWDTSKPKIPGSDEQARLGIKGPFRLNNFTGVDIHAGNTWEPEWLVHNWIAGQASGFDTHFRNETVVYNTTNQYHFRVVDLDPNNNLTNNSYNQVKYHIIRGRDIRLANEVLVSPQFARENDWKIGSVHELGGYPVTVVGYATDSYSFIPSADPANPIPNTNSGGVIFAYSNEIQQITQYVTVYPTTSVFFNHQNQNWNDQTVSQHEKLLNSYLMTNPTTVDKAINYYQQPNPPPYNANYSSLPMQNFNDSNYRYNWTVMPTGIKNLELVMFIAAGIVILLSLIACYIAVKRNIERNSAQIGILKSLGNKNSHIILSYLPYALFITFLIIPLGWIAGMFSELAITTLFFNFFSVNFSTIMFDWRPLLILLLGFGTLLVGVTYWSGYQILNQNIISILKSSEKWKSNRFVDYIKNRWFKNARFGTKFVLSITATSNKRIVVFFFIILVASLLITTSLAIPSFIANVSNSFYKNLNYKNSYQYQKLTYNVPLSKTTSVVWPGIDDVSQKYGTGTNYGYQYLNNSGQTTKVNGYQDPATYAASQQQNLPFKPFVYPTTGATNPTWAYSEYTNPQQTAQNIIGYIASTFGDNLYTASHGTFSVATIDEILDFLYHEQYTNQQDRLATVGQENAVLAAGIDQIFGQVIGQPVIQKPNQTWQQNIVDTLLTQVPPYIRNYLNGSPARDDQFSYGYSSNLLNQKTDIPTTTLPVNINNKNIGLTGVYNQNSLLNFAKGAENGAKNLLNNVTLPNPYGVNDSSNNLLYQLEQVIAAYDSDNPNAISKLHDVTTADGTKLYDSKTHTLTIPVILNDQAGAALNDKKTGLLPATDLSRAPQNGFEYLNNENKYSLLPKYAWAYNDSDYSATAQGSSMQTFYKNNPNLWMPDQSDTTTGHWLNPYNINNQYFTMHNNYNGTQVAKGAYAHIDSYDDPTTKTWKPFFRPDYEYKNLTLFLPVDKVNTNAYQDPGKMGKQWAQKVDSSQVPQSVKDAWGDNGQYLEIHPYDLDYDNSYNPNSPINNFTGKVTSWMYWARSPDHPLVRIGLVNNASSLKTLNNNNNPLHIQYDVKGYVSAYGGANAYADQNLVNLVAGYSNKPLNNYNLNSALDPTTKSNPVPTVNKDPSDLLKPKMYPANQFAFNPQNTYDGWYNSKYQDSVEPYDITTQYNSSLANNDAGYLATIYWPGQRVADNVMSQNLFGEKQKLINHLTTIGVSISVVLLAFVVVCALLLILLITNLFVSQYERFMVLMKTEGYSKRKIMFYTVNTFSPYTLVAWGLGVLLSYLFIVALHQIIFSLGLAIPFAVAWWVYVTSFALVMLMFASVFLFAYQKLNKFSSELIRTASDE